MRKGNFYVTIGYILQFLGVVGAITFYVLWFNNPELSLMQMLIGYWWIIVLSMFGGFTGGFLSVTGKHL